MDSSVKIYFYYFQSIKRTCSTEEKKSDFLDNVQHFSDLRQRVYNLSNKLTIWCVNAASSSFVFWTMQRRVNDWISDFRKNLERSNLAETILLKSEFDKQNRHLGTMFRESKNLRNICNENAVEEMFKLLKRMDVKMKSVNTSLIQREFQCKTQVIQVDRSKFEEEFKKNHDSFVLKQKVRLNCCFFQI